MKHHCVASSFRKAYVELIVRIFITGNDGLAKGVGIIVNDLYKRNTSM